MSSRDNKARWLQLFGGSLLALSFAFSQQAFAQAEDEDGVDATSDEDAIEEVIVTGSRLKRDTYSSVTPLQVISSEVSREVGLINPGKILQESTATGGTQIDLSFQGFVLDNGPGSSTVSLRGLGSNRTLVLINGRRAAPAGVEGAPYAADLNLIPGSLVSQYDVLLDGASSVYGSDAVAGVTNILLRKDFDGLELESYTSMPKQSGGLENTFSAVYGKNLDRGFFGIGVEYNDQEGVRFRDRDWTKDCNQAYEVDENGAYRSRDVYDEVFNGQRPTDCKRGSLAGRFYMYPAGFPLNSGFGSIYYDPGQGNVLPNWSESSLPFTGGWIDANGDGYNDVNYLDYDLTDKTREAHLFAEQQRISVMAYGEYTLSGESNITPFFEITYNKRKTFADSGAYQLFPDVPAGNPYNPCNPAAAGGADCGLAWDAFWDTPAGVQAQLDRYGTTYFGTGMYYEAGPIGAIMVEPIVSVDGDRTEVNAEVEQLRVVAGLRGDLPNLQWRDMDDWTWELSVSHTKSSGISHRNGVRDDRMNLALGWYSTTNTPCENDTGEVLESDVAPGCVPVNMFAPSLYDGVVGDFATAAERNYLFDSRDFDTDYTQDLINGYMTGDLYDLPAGSIAAGIGFEWRRDDINSMPDAVARDGLLFGFFSDGGAVGAKDTKEVFGEIEIPLLAGKPLAEELTLNLSTRRTKDEFYGSAWTYAGKLGYRPLPSLLLRATYGTSYRAPNLRENFLLAQSGFNNALFDPCVVPEDAWDALTQTYDPTQDTRDPWVLTNCENNGVDPRGALTGSGFTSAEVATDGVQDLTEETSDSMSVGFVWDQPFFESFGLSIGASFYRINVNDTIVEPSSQFIVNDCYNTATLNSPYCSRITRNATDYTIDYISAGFINRDNERVEGVDVNVAFDQSVTLFDRNIDLGIDLAANRSLERSETFIDENGNVSRTDDQGDWGYPDWKGRIALRADMGDWRATWSTNFIGEVDVAPAYRKEWSNIYDGAPFTCFGPDDGDVNCRQVTSAGKYILHSASLYYRGDVWTIGAGIRNVFDQEPPRVDTSANVSSRSNTPIGYGYDLNGRTYFLNVGAQFGL